MYGHIQVCMHTLNTHKCYDTHTRHRAINESSPTQRCWLTWTDPIYKGVREGFQEELEWWWDESGDKQLEGGWRKGGNGWLERQNKGLSYPCSPVHREVPVWYCMWATLTHYTQVDLWRRGKTKKRSGHSLSKHKSIPSCAVFVYRYVKP